MVYLLGSELGLLLRHGNPYCTSGGFRNLERGVHPLARAKRAQKFFGCHAHARPPRDNILRVRNVIILSLATPNFQHVHDTIIVIAS